MDDLFQYLTVLYVLAERLYDRLPYADPRPQARGHAFRVMPLEVADIRQDEVHDVRGLVHLVREGDAERDELLIHQHLLPEGSGRVGEGLAMHVTEVDAYLLPALLYPERHEMAYLVGGERVVRRRGEIARLLARRRRGLGLVVAHAPWQAIPSGPVYIACYDRQKHHAPLVVGPVEVLRRPPVCVGGRGLRGGELYGDPADVFGGNTRVLLRHLGGKLLQVRLELVRVVVRPCVYEVRIGKVLLHDNIGHGKGHYAVGPREYREPLVRPSGRVR